MYVLKKNNFISILYYCSCGLTLAECYSLLRRQLETLTDILIVTGSKWPYFTLSKCFDIYVYTHNLISRYSVHETFEEHEKRKHQEVDYTLKSAWLFLFIIKDYPLMSNYIDLCLLSSQRRLRSMYLWMASDQLRSIIITYWSCFASSTLYWSRTMAENVTSLNYFKDKQKQSICGCYLLTTVGIIKICVLLDFSWSTLVFRTYRKYKLR